MFAPVLLLSPLPLEGDLESAGKTAQSVIELHKAKAQRDDGEEWGSDGAVELDTQPGLGPAAPSDAQEPRRSEFEETEEAQGRVLSSLAALATAAAKTEVSRHMQSLLALPVVPLQAEGGPLRRCFVLLEDPGKSLCGKAISCILTLAILVSTAAFIMESMPEFRYRPEECAWLRRVGLPPTVDACEPVAHEAFHGIEVACISIFTVDYIIRVLCVHSGCDGVRQGVLRTLRYLVEPLNIIDLLAILPSYVNLAIGGAGKLGFVRLLRLARILRVLKLAKRSQGMQLIAEVLVKSGQPLAILLFFNMMIVLVFGSLIHFAEGQRFSVAPEFTQPRWDPGGIQTAAPFPTGVFVRKGLKSEDEATPFRSIPYSMWWVCVTLTTVGYGDYAPTTSLGKVIGVACFYTGVLFIALPFSVMSSNFELVYEKHTTDKEQKERELKKKKDRMLAKATVATAALSFWDVPWFPETKMLRRNVFFVLEQPTASKVGRLVSIVMMGAIIAVMVSFIVESMPEFNKTPDACKDNLTVENCKPQPQPIFLTIEMVGVILFSVDYVLRVLTVHTAPPEACGLAPGRAYTPLTTTLAYCQQWMNLLDLLAIVPFYLELVLGVGSGAGTSVLRVFRLVRVFRMLKTPKLSSGVTMFANIVGDSVPALGLLFSLTLLGCVFFASCLTFAESSWYSVDHFQEEFPEGLYIRPTRDGHGVEPSPFRSILYTFWWFFATATTVGYGDDFPTTTAGRCIGVLTAYVGILLIALPVTIVGGNFSKYYADWALGMQDPDKAEESQNES